MAPPYFRWSRRRPDTFIAAKAERWVRDGWKGWTGFQSWMLYAGCTDYGPIRDDEVEHAKHDIAAWYAKPIEPFHYCAPQYLSAGTSIAPIEWVSRLVPCGNCLIGGTLRDRIKRGIVRFYPFTHHRLSI